MKICTTCEYIGEEKKLVRGSFIMELALWLCFLIPGLFYSLWRVTSKRRVCPCCELTGTMIPADSALGMKLQKGE